MTALRLDRVGTGHPHPCRRAPGRSKALGGGAALASSARVWAVLNTLLRDFTETRHGKDPGLVRWEPRIQEAGSSSRAFSCADSHGGGGVGSLHPLEPQALSCRCLAWSVAPRQGSSTSGAYADRRPGLTPRASASACPAWAHKVSRLALSGDLTWTLPSAQALPPVRARAQGAPGSPALRTPVLPPSLEPQLFFTLSHISFCLRPALPAFTCRTPNLACVLSCSSCV